MSHFWDTRHSFLICRFWKKPLNILYQAHSMEVFIIKAGGCRAYNITNFLVEIIFRFHRWIHWAVWCGMILNPPITSLLALSWTNHFACFNGSEVDSSNNEDNPNNKGSWKVKTSNEPKHDTTNKMTCMPSEDSAQPEHPPSLFRDFASCPMGSQVPKVSSCWHIDSDLNGWMPRLILSLHRAYRSFCLFFRTPAQISF